MSLTKAMGLIFLNVRQSFSLLYFAMFSLCDSAVDYRDGEEYVKRVLQGENVEKFDKNFLMFTAPFKFRLGETGELLQKNSRSQSDNVMLSFPLNIAKQGAMSYASEFSRDYTNKKINEKTKHAPFRKSTTQYQPYDYTTSSCPTFTQTDPTVSTTHPTTSTTEAPDTTTSQSESSTITNTPSEITTFSSNTESNTETTTTNPQQHRPRMPFDFRFLFGPGGMSPLGVGPFCGYGVPFGLSGLGYLGTGGFRNNVGPGGFRVPGGYGGIFGPGGHRGSDGCKGAGEPEPLSVPESFLNAYKPLWPPGSPLQLMPLDLMHSPGPLFGPLVPDYKHQINFTGGPPFLPGPIIPLLPMTPSSNLDRGLVSRPGPYFGDRPNLRPYSGLRQNSGLIPYSGPGQNTGLGPYSGYMQYQGLGSYSG